MALDEEAAALMGIRHKSIAATVFFMGSAIHLFPGGVEENGLGLPSFSVSCGTSLDLNQGLHRAVVIPADRKGVSQ